MVGETVNRGGRFLLLLLIARDVGAESYAGWVLAVAAATVLANAGDAGIGTIAAREIAADERRTAGYVANLLVLAPLLALAGAAVVAGLAAVAPGGTSHSLMLTVGFGGVLESTGYLLLSPLRGQGRFLPEALFRATQGALLLLAGGAAVVLADGGAPLVALLFPATAAVALLLAVVAVTRSAGRVRPRFDRAIAGSLVASALPLFASTVVFFLYFRIDAYLLAYLKGEEPTGLYGAAYNFAFGLAFLPLMVGRAALTKFAASGSGAELRLAYRGTVRSTALLAGGISAALAALTPIFLLAYGTDFSGAQTPYLILIGAQALYFFTHLNYMLIIARGRARMAWALTLVALALNLSVNAALIPILAATGAAIAMVSSETALVAIQAVLVRRQLSAPAGDRCGTAPERLTRDATEPRVA